ncbi:DUF2235 domain-containing protein [Pseudomonas sp. B21-028]|uniref:T6SS phospholipase effector Tle1-like catalytic domain-containing protein n=1 Tax=Pseudomonas sp. B21-028 TaxID=2895480 RepID=UPI002160C8A4|nr:DUF2235 domain-containing protein [Pseudomonas sp. B21-028]UVL83774.1 DUF2235 domain-containing protein [Pseudomonas sp. B21-028]
MPGKLKNRSQALAVTPFFTNEGLLPRTPKDVTRNQVEQQRLLTEAANISRTACRAANVPYSGPPCMDVLHITLCFDGTNNHEPTDKRNHPPTTSNVARLYHASLGGDTGPGQSRANEAGFYAYYMQGVGTGFPEVGEFEPDAMGLVAARGGENRINWGLTRLIDALRRHCGEPHLEPAQAFAWVRQMSSGLGDALNTGQARRRAVLEEPLTALRETVERLHASHAIPRIKALRLYVYGFSRGAAQARTFTQWLRQLTEVEANGETCHLFAGVPISIGFLGLFDTVASVGMAYLAPFVSGHMGWADGSLRLPESQVFLERCVHMVAAHEQRGSFPLDSIRRKADPDDPDCPSTYRTDTFEYLYPGVHSDVGGGYPPGDQGKALGGNHELLSQLPLQHMFHEAYQVGAPLQAPADALSDEQKERWPWLVMDGGTYDAFDISPTLVHRFNIWLDAQDNGPLEQVMAREAGLITGWRISRYANFLFRTTPAWAHVQGKDMSEEERSAFAALHRRQREEDTALRAGKEPPAVPVDHESHLALKRAYEQRTSVGEIALNTAKTFEPSLDQRQLHGAMLDFRRDYVPEWNLNPFGSGLSQGRLINASVGGLVYLLNEQDEAEEYRDLRRAGTREVTRWFGEDLVPRDDEAWELARLFDEHVHDSRAWFMNAVLDEREVFSDYFRYRAIFFDDESNKRLSLLATAGQVIGVAVALAGVGLSVSRRDPRLLVGLLMPGLGIPVLRGKLGIVPTIEAFDSATGIVLPLVEGLDEVRAYTRQVGNVLKLAQALPSPTPLNEQTADSRGWQPLLDAIQSVRKPEGGWLGRLRQVRDDATKAPVPDPGGRGSGA